MTAAGAAIGFAICTEMWFLHRAREYSKLGLTTSAASPFATVEIDLAVADAAKHTYPRYVADR